MGNGIHVHRAGKVAGLIWPCAVAARGVAANAREHLRALLKPRSIAKPRTCEPAEVFKSYKFMPKPKHKAKKAPTKPKSKPAATVENPKKTSTAKFPGNSW